MPECISRQASPDYYSTSSSSSSSSNPSYFSPPPGTMVEDRIVVSNFGFPFIYIIYIYILTIE